MDPVRQHVLNLLDGREAHADFKAAVADFPKELWGTKPSGAPHTAWQLLEHLRIAQSDILAFTKDARHKSPEWPKAYWPPTPEPPNATAWDKSVESFARDLAEMKKIVADSKIDLTAPLPHSDGQTPLREALLLADHNAYHIGQLVMLRVMLGAWNAS